ncbi:hypothetical protein ACWCQP_50435 [Streptomyces chartreusis]
MLQQVPQRGLDALSTLGPSSGYWVAGIIVKVKQRLSASGRQPHALTDATSASVGRATTAVAAAPSNAVA